MAKKNPKDKERATKAKAKKQPAKQGELTDEQLIKVAGGRVGASEVIVTKRMDAASQKLL